jgi:poly(3-hydroxybutyrate) depolymerase
VDTSRSLRRGEGGKSMSRRKRKWIMSIAISAALMLSGNPANAKVVGKTKTIKRTTVHYLVVLPNGFDPAKSYPGVLAFPGGPQTMETVEGTLERNWQEEAERRGYIVVIPAAPGALFFQGGEAVFPDFVVELLKDYKILNNKFHIAGLSNGGISAFHIAAMYPEYFLSVTGFPGFLQDATPEHVRAISKMCINMYVGALDKEWLGTMQKQAAAFRAVGMNVQFSVENGQSHRVGTLEGRGAGRLFNRFEEAQQGCAK